MNNLPWDFKAKENVNLTLQEQKRKYADERKRFDAHQAFLNSGLPITRSIRGLPGKLSICHISWSLGY
mgnify:CR=1 FL=1